MLLWALQAYVGIKFIQEDSKENRLLIARFYLGFAIGYLIVTLGIGFISSLLYAYWSYEAYKFTELFDQKL